MYGSRTRLYFSKLTFVPSRDVSEGTGRNALNRIQSGSRQLGLYIRNGWSDPEKHHPGLDRRGNADAGR